MNVYPADFAKVDDRVWRGARPDAYQAKALVEQGVRTVIDLEWEQSDQGLWPPGHFVLGGTKPDQTIDPTRPWIDVDLVRIRDFEPLPFFAPSLADEHVVAALRAIKAGPPIVFVHCKSGQNRTGVVVAAYRLLVLGQPIEGVIADFKSYRGLWAWPDEGYIQSIDKW